MDQFLKKDSRAERGLNRSPLGCTAQAGPIETKHVGRKEKGGKKAAPPGCFPGIPPSAWSLPCPQLPPHGDTHSGTPDPGDREVVLPSGAGPPSETISSRQSPG